MRDDFVRTTRRLQRLKQTMQSMAEVAYGQAEQSKQKAETEWRQTVIAARHATEKSSEVLGTAEWTLWQQYQSALAVRAKTEETRMFEADALVKEHQRAVESAYFETQRWSMLVHKLEVEKTYETLRKASREADEHALNRYGKES